MVRPVSCLPSADILPADILTEGPTTIVQRLAQALLLLAALFAAPILAAQPAQAQRAVGLPSGPGLVRAIQVEGNQRIEESTIRNYMLIAPGDPFDAETAGRLERHILSAGGSEEADRLYTAFRGRMPGVEPMLRGRGLLEAARPSAV